MVLRVDVLSLVSQVFDDEANKVHRSVRIVVTCEELLQISVHGELAWM